MVVVCTIESKGGMIEYTSLDGWVFKGIAYGGTLPFYPEGMDEYTALEKWAVNMYYPVLELHFDTGYASYDPFTQDYTIYSYPYYVYANYDKEKWNYYNRETVSDYWVYQGLSGIVTSSWSISGWQEICVVYSKGETPEEPERPVPPIPEPGTICLLGLGGLALLRNRRV